MYDINNGLLLSRALHTLFDRYLLSVNSNSEVVLSKKILSKKSYKNYHKYNNLKIKLNEETLKYIENHYKKYLDNVNNI